MSYDVDDEPTSVELQRELEDRLADLAEAITQFHVILVGALAIIAHTLATGEPDPGATSAASSWLAGVTLVDVGTWVAIAIALGLLLVAVIAVHELCHWHAFEYLGIPADWGITVPEIAGYKLYCLPKGGLCWPLDIRKAARMSYTESAFVSLAPLAFSAVGVAAVLAYHVFVDPFGDLWFPVALVVLFTGPSPPDWWSLTHTPRERWETLVAVESRLEEHAAAEGIEVGR